MKRMHVFFGPSEDCGDFDCGVDHEKGWLYMFEGHPSMPDPPKNLEQADHLLIIGENIDIISHHKNMVTEGGYRFLPLKNAQPTEVRLEKPTGGWWDKKLKVQWWPNDHEGFSFSSWSY